jgi:hypothetical protein
MRLESSGCLRNYTLEGREINSITFYGSLGVIAKTRGWVESQSFDANLKPHSFTNDVKWLEVDQLVLARKENLKRQDNYYIPTRKGTVLSSEPSRYDIYIYVPADNSQSMGEKLVMDCDSEKRYATFVQVMMTCGLKQYTGKDQFDGSPIYEVNEEPGFIVATGYRSEKTAFAGEVEAMAAEFKAKGVPVSGYALDMLLKHYNVTPKA